MGKVFIAGVSKDRFKIRILESEDVIQTHSLISSFVGAKKSADYRYTYIPNTDENMYLFRKLRKQFNIKMSVKKGLQEKVVEYLKRADDYEKLRASHNKVVQFLQSAKIKQTDLSEKVKLVTVKRKLYWHQNYLYLLGTRCDSCGFFGDTGVGKTAPAILSIEKRIKRGQVKKALVIVLGSLKLKWAEGIDNELEKHSALKGRVLTGTHKKRDKIIREFLSDDTDVLVTSFSFWSGRQEHAGAYAKHYQMLASAVDMVVIDECHKIKNPDANVTKNVIEHLGQKKYKIIMTGTPSTKTLIDLYSQYRFIDVFTFGNSLTTFREKYFVQNETTGKFDFKSPELTAELIEKAMNRALVFRQDECIDLPKAVTQIVSIPTSPEYVRFVRGMEEIDIDEDGDISVRQRMAVSRMLTAVNGFVYTGTRTPPRLLGRNPKEEAIKDFAKQVQFEKEKCVMWHMFTYDAVVISTILKKLKIKHLIITRKHSDEEKYNRIKQFERDDSVFLVSSPKLIGTGQDILAPKYSAFYNINFDWEVIHQAFARNRRLGSLELHDKIIYVFFIMRNSIEEKAWRSLIKKEGVKSLLFGETATLRSFRNAESKNRRVT